MKVHASSQPRKFPARQAPSKFRCPNIPILRRPSAPYTCPPSRQEAARRPGSVERRHSPPLPVAVAGASAGFSRPFSSRFFLVFHSAFSAVRLRRRAVFPRSVFAPRSRFVRDKRADFFARSACVLLAACLRCASRRRRFFPAVLPTPCLRLAPMPPIAPGGRRSRRRSSRRVRPYPFRSVPQKRHQGRRGSSRSASCRWVSFPPGLSPTRSLAASHKALQRAVDVRAPICVTYSFTAAAIATPPAQRAAGLRTVQRRPERVSRAVFFAGCFIVSS